MKLHILNSINIKKMSVATLVTSLIVGQMLQSASLNAQQADLEVSLSPPLTHVVIQPGKKALGTVTVENQGTYDLELVPRFVDFASDNESGEPVFLDSMSFPYIFLQNEDVKIDQAFSLKTGSSKQLLFEFNLPESAIEREYHFTLIMDLQPVRGEQLGEGSTTAVSGKITSNFIVTVTRTPQDRGVIEISSFEGPLFLDSLSSVQAQLFVKNAGPNTTVTLGDFKILDIFGKVVYEDEILPQNILPNSIRELKGSEDVLDNGESFQIEKPFYWKPLFLLGPYRLVFTFHAPGQENQTFTHTVFALPVSLLIFLVSVYILYLLYAKTGLFTLDRKRETAETEETQ